MLNILIRKAHRDLDTDPVAVVAVRNKFSEIDAPDARIVIRGRRVWDANAKNRMGTMGASAMVVDASEIAAAVAALSAKFGAMDVQNNLPAGMIAS